jgi:hypothetical protein
MRFEEEDFERAHLKDQMYLEEYQKEIEEEWQKWEEEHPSPAKIVVLKPFKTKKHEQRDQSTKLL